MSSQYRRLSLALMTGLVLSPLLAADRESKSTTARAPLPKRESFPQSLFFKDAFREALVGPRPPKLGRSTAPVRKSPTPEQAPTRSRGFQWSQLVSAETLEFEVKALQMSVEQNVTTPARFSSGGFKVARREFSELAVLFAVIGEYDLKVRWKKAAPAVRDSFAKAAANSKVGSPLAFQEAKQRKQDLQDLVRGASLGSNPAASQVTDWEHVSDRRPLMERFTGCFDEGIVKWTANAEQLAKNTDAIVREAELLRTFATVLQRNGMEDAGDEGYQAYCVQLVLAVGDLLEAVRRQDELAARKAVGNVGQACNRCHEDYRG